MLFDHGCAQRDGWQRRPHAHRVVRKADFAAERVAQVRDRRKIGVFRRRRIGAGAFEQHRSLQPAALAAANRLVDIGKGRHAGGDDHRLAGGCHFADQRQVGVLERGDLVGRRAELSSNSTAVASKGVEKAISRVAGALEERPRAIPGRVGLLIEGVQRAAAQRLSGSSMKKSALLQVERHGVGRVGLQLDGVAPVAAAASTIASARSSDWLWLPDISAMINGRCDRPIERPAMVIVSLIGSSSFFNINQISMATQIEKSGVALRIGHAQQVELLRDRSVGIKAESLQACAAGSNSAHGPPEAPALHAQLAQAHGPSVQVLSRKGGC